MTMARMSSRTVASHCGKSLAPVATRRLRSLAMGRMSCIRLRSTYRGGGGRGGRRGSYGHFIYMMSCMRRRSTCRGEGGAEGGVSYKHGVSLLG